MLVDRKAQNQQSTAAQRKGTAGLLTDPVSLLRLVAEVEDLMDTIAARLAQIAQAAALLPSGGAALPGDTAMTPSAAVGGGAGLTAREAEIAGLAAWGLSDREISERLTLSVRTVESHLSRVYRKLGVRSRRELRGGHR